MGFILKPAFQSGSVLIIQMRRDTTCPGSLRSTAARGLWSCVARGGAAAPIQLNWLASKAMIHPRGIARLTRAVAVLTPSNAKNPSGIGGKPEIGCDAGP